jgi:hypothetical protein
VFRFDRPWNFAFFDQGIELLENHLQDTF